MLPIFISPPSSGTLMRLYTYDQQRKELGNYVVYQKQQRDSWRETFNCRSAYGLRNMSAGSWYTLARSFLHNDSRSFSVYQDTSLRGELFARYCRGASAPSRTACAKCRSNCFIVFLEQGPLAACLHRCVKVSSLSAFEDGEQNSGFLFVFAVIAGFVIILVGIVLAVNKVYCIRRGRQRNLFLAPLTLNIQAEAADDSAALDLGGAIIIGGGGGGGCGGGGGPVAKGVVSKDDVDDGGVCGGGGGVQVRSASNGFRRSNHEVEQTYNYIRM